MFEIIDEESMLKLWSARKGGIPPAKKFWLTPQPEMGSEHIFMFLPLKMSEKLPNGK